MLVGVIRQNHAPSYVEWEIKNYFSYTEVDAFLESPEFSLADKTVWNLVYETGEYYVKIRVDKMESNKEYDIAFKVGILKCDGSKFNVRKVYHTFTKKRGNYLFEDFCSISDITKWTDDIISNGAMKIFCDFDFMQNSDDTSKTYPSKCLDVLIENYKKLYIGGIHSDVTITVKGKDFQAHKSILAARSPVFAAMFEHDMVEKNSNSVTITDCDPGSFNEFLLFLYTGKMEDVSSSNAFSLYETAKKYDVKELKEECVHFMECNLSVDTFVDAVIIATNHEETELFQRATKFFVQNSVQILVSAMWESFIAEYPTIANELILEFAGRVEGALNDAGIHL